MSSQVPDAPYWLAALRFPAEEAAAEGWESDLDRIGAAVMGRLARFDSGEVPDVGTAIVLGVAIKDFLVPAGVRYADPMVASYDRREVGTDDDDA